MQLCDKFTLEKSSSQKKLQQPGVRFLSILVGRYSFCAQVTHPKIIILTLRLYNTKTLDAPLHGGALTRERPGPGALVSNREARSHPKGRRHFRLAIGGVYGIQQINSDVQGKPKLETEVEALLSVSRKSYELVKQKKSSALFGIGQLVLATGHQVLHTNLRHRTTILLSRHPSL